MLQPAAYLLFDLSLATVELFFLALYRFDNYGVH